jgi:hypothetical protein
MPVRPSGFCGRRLGSRFADVTAHPNELARELTSLHGCATVRWLRGLDFPIRSGLREARRSGPPRAADGDAGVVDVQAGVEVPVLRTTS